MLCHPVRLAHTLQGIDQFLLKECSVNTIVGVKVNYLVNYFAWRACEPPHNPFFREKASCERDRHTQMKNAACKKQILFIQLVS